MLDMRAGGRGENFVGRAKAWWEEALNFLDFFASFLGQAKMKYPYGIRTKWLNPHYALEIYCCC